MVLIMTLKFGSLFAGIGGIDLGLERAGMKCLWQVEYDEYANKVLEKHWPGVKRYGDIRTVDFTKAEYVDVLAGGFPCQDISNAGKRIGIKGERSGLWQEFARAIREIRPKYVIVENVSALRHRGLDTVLAGLAKSGYDAEWDCIPAQSVGAPHRRDRIFIVAHHTNSCGHIHRQIEKQPTKSGKYAQREPIASSQDVAHTNRKRIQRSAQSRKIKELWAFRKELIMRHFKRNRGRYWATDAGVLRVAHGVPDRVDRIKCIGNAVVPQVAEVIGNMVVNHANTQKN